MFIWSQLKREWSIVSEIMVLGISHNRLQPGHRQLLRQCAAVVSGKRFLPLLEGLDLEIIPVVPLAEMIKRMKNILRTGTVAVLASGDPLFYGIGRTLLKNFPADNITFFPALSAMQLACAAFKTPWDDLELLSLHGRNRGWLAGKLLTTDKLMLFTDHRNSPDRIASELLQSLREYGADNLAENFTVQVAENLGLADEKISLGSLQDMAKQHFSPLNMMLLCRKSPVQVKAPLGLTENEIIHSRGLITKDEVRAVILHRLKLPPTGVFWDVGGGSGSISLEAAGLCPDLDIFTIEQKQEEQENIRANIRRHHLFSIRLIAGQAPEQLRELPAPDRVFIGGSSGRLAEIITCCSKSIRPGGRIVASAVLKKTAETAPKFMKQNGLRVDLRTIQVFRHPTSEKNGQQLNPITIITGIK